MFRFGDDDAANPDQDYNLWDIIPTVKIEKLMIPRIEKKIDRLVL